MQLLNRCISSFRIRIAGTAKRSARYRKKIIGATRPLSCDLTKSWWHVFVSPRNIHYASFCLFQTRHQFEDIKVSARGGEKMSSWLSARRRQSGEGEVQKKRRKGAASACVSAMVAGPRRVVESSRLRCRWRRRRQQTTSVFRRSNSRCVCSIWRSSIMHHKEALMRNVKLHSSSDL